MLNIKQDTVDDKVLHYYASKVVDNAMKPQKALTIIKKMVKGKADSLASHVKQDIETRFSDAVDSMHRVKRITKLAKQLN